jgi:hypothetical protein
MKRLVILVALVVAACGSGTPTVPPTIHVPEPTRNPTPTLAAPTVTPVPTPLPAPLVITGSGDAVEGPFELAAGFYRLDWVIGGRHGEECFVAIGIQTVPDGVTVASTVSEMAPEGGTVEGAKTFDVAGGSFVMTVDGDDCDWTITATPLG